MALDKALKNRTAWVDVSDQSRHQVSLTSDVAVVSTLRCCRPVSLFAFVRSPAEYDENVLFFRRIGIVLVNITGQRLAIDLRRLRIQRDISPSEVSREVEIQLAAFDDDPAAPRTLSTVEFP